MSDPEIVWVNERWEEELHAQGFTIVRRYRSTNPPAREPTPQQEIIPEDKVGYDELDWKEPLD